MSEFERSQSAVPPFVPTARSDRFATEADLEPAALPAENPFPREGLPPGFRMRHDAHYVDQLTARAAAPHVRLLPLRDLDSARTIDAREIEPLVKSIKKYGVLQPLHVRPRAGRFDLIAGHRRLAAASAAGLTEVPCLVHQVDDTRARAIAEADNLRVGDTAGTPADTGLSDVPASGLAELSQSFSAIGSCLHLLGDRDTALRDRVALDLIRTEVHRAGRLVRCLHVLRQDPSLSEISISLATIVDQVVESFAAELRLSGVSVDVDATRELQTAHADPDWLTVGVSGALGGMLALVQQAKHASLQVRVGSSSSGSSVLLEIDQQVTTVPVWAQGRFFDSQWTDRPGGYQAAAELAAAKRVSELHRGGVELVPGDRGGCRLVMLLPTA